ncbi:hypothetical protein F511_26086 [Dorcoceras hygrometricum]|uniref:Uncharacterized protein n=1 Tax=Dorcoceras hygrometricum TaxID=472368 RepID=A0A2Z7CQW1_9LAMI|nr:hypothetical protein F511_26086 [Dorcoceras hygrometricum]
MYILLCSNGISHLLSVSSPIQIRTKNRSKKRNKSCSGAGKWVCLVTLAMSLFDLEDVCIIIGSLANLDLPMVVDLIGIYVLKGPYCTLTMTDWFLQALSVIPRPPSPPPILPCCRRAPRVAAYRDRTCSDRRAEEIPFVSNSSVLIVQADEGFVLPIVDLIRRSTAAYLLKCRFPCETGRSQAPRRQRGPRPEAGFLRQPALEGLTNLGRTESPRHADRNKSNHVITGGGRRWRKKWPAAVRLMKRRGGAF